ncbi:MAG: hypothetical protein IJD25_01075, partial [Alphaproteobacteria bacterium]|nr:hypothetical protein [Alphaproteobacteria bacterium]
MIVLAGTFKYASTITNLSAASGSIKEILYDSASEIKGSLIGISTTNKLLTFEVSPSTGFTFAGWTIVIGTNTYEITEDCEIEGISVDFENTTLTFSNLTKHIEIYARVDRVEYSLSVVMQDVSAFSDYTTYKARYDVFNGKVVFAYYMDGASKNNVTATKQTVATVKYRQLLNIEILANDAYWELDSPTFTYTTTAGTTGFGGLVTYNLSQGEISAYVYDNMTINLAVKFRTFRIIFETPNGREYENQIVTDPAIKYYPGA